MRIAVGLVLALASNAAADVSFADVDLAGADHVVLPARSTWTDAATGVAITIVGGAELRIYDLVRFSGSHDVPGNGLIDWHWPDGKNTDGTLFRFDRPVTSFSLEAGDWTSDDDDELVLEAFDCHGQRVAHVVRRWPITQGPPFARLAVKAHAICSARYRSGGPYAGSTFITHLAVIPGAQIAR